MNESEPLKDGLSNRIKKFLFDDFGAVIILIIVIVLYISSGSLLTKPRIWVDEASSIEQSHNLLRSGTPDIEIAPGQFTGVPYLIQSTGYPITVPLALVFKVFGYGFAQARVYMLVWVIVALFMVFYSANKFFGNFNAIFSFLLVASFASFYANGLTVVGEIPGFVFLLVGLLYLQRGSYFLTGLVWGLAVVAKPSVFLPIIPAIVLTFLFERGGFFKKTISVGLGMIPAGLLWIWILLPHPFSGDVWSSIVTFYANPYGSVIIGNITNNLAGFFHSVTLIYFCLLFLLILGARFILKNDKVGVIYTFTLVYSLLAFGIYLRSPGWLRYILISELLILFILPHAVITITGRYAERFKVYLVGRKKIYVIFLSLLLFLQIGHFVTGAKLFYSDSELKTAEFLNLNFPDDSIAVYNSLTLFVLLEQKDRYQVVGTNVIPISGISSAFSDPKPLFVKPPVDLIVFSKNQKFSSDEEKVIKDVYSELYDDHGYVVYRLKSLSIDK